MSQALKQLRNSTRDKHEALLKEMQDFIESSNDIQEFLNECLLPKAGLFDLLRYNKCLKLEHPPLN
jgi:hypothetical protein